MNLRPKQAAEHLGVSLATFWRLRRQDPSFPRVIKLGPQTSIVRQSELDEWLNAKAEAQAESERQAPRRALRQSGAMAGATA